MLFGAVKYSRAYGGHGFVTGIAPDLLLFCSLLLHRWTLRVRAPAPYRRAAVAGTNGRICAPGPRLRPVYPPRPARFRAPRGSSHRRPRVCCQRKGLWDASSGLRRHRTEEINIFWHDAAAGAIEAKHAVTPHSDDPTAGPGSPAGDAGSAPGNGLPKSGGRPDSDDSSSDESGSESGSDDADAGTPAAGFSLLAALKSMLPSWSGLKKDLRLFFACATVEEWKERRIQANFRRHTVPKALCPTAAYLWWVGVTDPHSPGRYVRAPRSQCRRAVGCRGDIADGPPRRFVRRRFKPGRDLYVQTITVQLVTLIAILFGFSSLYLPYGGEGIASQLSNSQFSGSMVGCWSGGPLVCDVFCCAPLRTHCHTSTWPLRCPDCGGNLPARDHRGRPCRVPDSVRARKAVPACTVPTVRDAAFAPL